MVANEPGEARPVHGDAEARGGASEAAVEIDAPAAAVWSILADLDRWGDWNPLYPAMAGKAGVGESLLMTAAVPGLKLQTVRAVVTAAEAPHRLDYAARAMAGLVYARRYIAILPLGESRCRVVNGERMEGLLGPLVARMVGAKVARGLEAMNAALKLRAENRI